MEFIKKAGLTFWLNAAAGLTALIAFIIMLVSNATPGYVIDAVGLAIAAAIIAVLAIGGAAYLAETKFDGQNPIVAGLNLLALVLEMVVFGIILMGRVVLASALFSFDSRNLVGWGAFNSSVAAMVFIFITVALLIVTAFLGKKKEA